MQQHHHQKLTNFKWEIMQNLKINKIELTSFSIELKDLKENQSGIGVHFEPGYIGQHIRFGIKIYDSDGSIGEYVPPRGRRM